MAPGIAVALASLAGAWCPTCGPQSSAFAVDDGSPWHVHDRAFRVRVEPREDANARWSGPRGETLGAAVALRAGVPARLASPIEHPGHVTLELRGAGAVERLGFAILPALGRAPLDPFACLGTIHVDDVPAPLGGWVKTSSWQW